MLCLWTLYIAPFLYPKYSSLPLLVRMEITIENSWSARPISVVHSGTGSAQGPERVDILLSCPAEKGSITQF